MFALQAEGQLPCALHPPRLKAEMAQLQEAVLSGKDLRDNEMTEKHADWMEEILSRRSVTEDNIGTVIQEEIGLVFTKVLECAGVYKRTEEGKAAFLRFVDRVNGKGV